MADEREGLTRGDIVHGMLVAVLISHGGSYEFDITHTELDALGDADGRFYAIAMEPVGGPGTHRIRLSVVPTRT